MIDLWLHNRLSGHHHRLLGWHHHLLLRRWYWLWNNGLNHLRLLSLLDNLYLIWVVNKCVDVERKVYFVSSSDFVPGIVLEPRYKNIIYLEHSSSIVMRHRRSHMFKVTTSVLMSETCQFSSKIWRGSSQRHWNIDRSLFSFIGTHSFTSDHI